MSVLMSQLLLIFSSDVTVKFDSLLYRVSEGSGPVTARLVLQGDTSNTVAVRLRTIDQGAVGKFQVGSFDTLPTSGAYSH